MIFLEPSICFARDVGTRRETLVADLFQCAHLMHLNYFRAAEMANKNRGRGSRPLDVRFSAAVGVHTEKQIPFFILVIFLADRNRWKEWRPALKKKSVSRKKKTKKKTA